MQWNFNEKYTINVRQIATLYIHNNIIDTMDFSRLQLLNKSITWV